MKLYRITPLSWFGKYHTHQGKYEIIPSEEEHVLYYSDHFESTKFEPVATLEECQALAQEDHEKRVTKALEDLDVERFIPND